MNDLYLIHKASKSKYKGGFVTKNGRLNNSKAYNHDYYMKNKDRWKDHPYMDDEKEDWEDDWDYVVEWTKKTKRETPSRI